MKKIFISVLAVSLGAGYICHDLHAPKSEPLSPAALANIDALTDFEGGETEEKHDCYKTITSKKASKVFFCVTCDWVDNATDVWYSPLSKCPE